MLPLEEAPTAGLEDAMHAASAALLEQSWRGMEGSYRLADLCWPVVALGLLQEEAALAGTVKHLPHVMQMVAAQLSCRLSYLCSCLGTRQALSGDVPQQTQRGEGETV